MDQWATGLSDQQMSIARTSGSHARLLAGPGTGKTYTLAAHVAYLVTQVGVPASEILVITFTRLATRQLREKIDERLSGLTDQRPYVATLHGFALRQLLRNSERIRSLPQPLRIADDWEERNLIRQELKLQLNRNLKQIDSAFKLLAADWQRLSADEEDVNNSGPDPAFIGAWREHRRVYGYTLRNELVYQLKRALEQVPDFDLEPRFRYVLVDEYQDLNACDLSIIKSFADLDLIVIACGDDDQSIYGFRHSDPSGIRSFITHFPGAKDLSLTECWRCGSAILDAALYVAKLDHKRVDKVLNPVPATGEGEVKLLRFASGNEEALGVATICKKLIDAGTPAGSILILLRSDHQYSYSSLLREAFASVGVPIVTDAKPKPIVDEDDGRRLLAALRIIENRADHLAWRSLLELEGGIGEATIGALYSQAVRKGNMFTTALEMYSIVPGLSQVSLRRLEEIYYSTMSLVNQFSPGSQSLQNQTDEERSAALWEQVRAVAAELIQNSHVRSRVLKEVGDQIKSSRASSLASLLGSLVEADEEIEPALETDAVNVLTMHKAKGLTAEVVFVIAAEDGVLPRDDAEAGGADDRRLLYVSMTRAKSRLFITYAGRRFGAQAYTGTTNKSHRNLTHFLADGPLKPIDGATYADVADFH